MIEMIKCPQPVTEKTQWTAFLAGPMNGAPSWQAQAPKVAEKVGIENLTLLNPSYEALALLCHHHQIGDGRESGAWA